MVLVFTTESNQVTKVMTFVEMETFAFNRLAHAYGGCKSCLLLPIFGCSSECYYAVLHLSSPIYLVIVLNM